MGNNTYYKQTELFFSSIYGSGVYEWNNQYVQDPIGSDNGTGCVSPLLTNKLTGESYFIKRLDCDEKSYIWRKDKFLSISFVFFE